ncbi:MAG: nucleotide-binding protein [Clostridia bacterium]|nr:nucleotide-binding protein [Clostridia bacterium]
MKDKVFIAWSGNSEVATRVREILKEHDYMGYVGGNEDNNSTRFTIGDTVIHQMNECNQFIAILQKKDGNIVSSNLYFELGYALARYGVKKVHAVRKKSEELDIPSDLNSFMLQPVVDGDVETFARGIVQYFLERQKMSVDENKMQLIDNRYQLHNMIAEHYSPSGSLCSDYELAQYILFYMHSAQMFGDEKGVFDEISEFQRKHYQEFSPELRMSVELCIAFLKLLLEVKLENGMIFVEDIAYSEYLDVTEDILSGLSNGETTGIFVDWIRLLVTEQNAYAHMLYAGSPENDDDTRDSLYEMVITAALDSLELIKSFVADHPICIENNDNTGFLSLIRAYLYRNLFVSYKHFGESEKAFEALEKSKDERASLKAKFANGAIDSKIYDTFLMEYYLIIAEYIQYARDNSLSVNMVRLGIELKKIGKYLEHIKAEESEKHNIYVKRIEEYHKELIGQ